VVEQALRQLRIRNLADFLRSLCRNRAFLPVTVLDRRMDDSTPRATPAQRNDRASDLHFRQSAGEHTAKLTETFPVEHGSASLRVARVAISKKGVVRFAYLSDILTVVAQNNCVLLQCTFGSCRLRGSISVVARKLEPYGFVRINRSVLVNRRWVEEIRPCQTGEQVLRLKGDKEFAITRTYKKNVKSLAEVWLDSDTLSREVQALNGPDS
jgi:DNA-binding LytR/AlgR family response regulator